MTAQRPQELGIKAGAHSGCAPAFTIGVRQSFTVLRVGEHGNIEPAEPAPEPAPVPESLHRRYGGHFVRKSYSKELRSGLGFGFGE